MYLLKERFWSWGTDFDVRDESGEPVYHVDGRAFSFGHKLSMLDRSGREVAFIRQKLLTWLPKYEIHRDGRLFATIRKEFTWLRSKFTLDVPGPNDYLITGDLFDYEYEFQRDGRTVASVSKRFFSLTDAYGIDVLRGEDDVAILATAVVVDMVCHGPRD